MSISDLCALLMYGAVTVALGRTVVLLSCKATTLRDGAVYFLVGQLVWLLIFLLASFSGVPTMYLVWGGVGLALLSVMPRGLRPGISALQQFIIALLITVGVVVLCFPQVVYPTAKLPLEGWDARSIWFFHAKAIWVNNGITATFFGNSAYAWSHQDYPLLLPVQAAVLGVMRGEWNEMAVKSFLLLNFMAYLWLLYRVLRVRGAGQVAAGAAAVVLMQIAATGYVDGYADNHYALPLLLAAMLIASPEQSQRRLALLPLVYALNVKNEALFFVVAGGLVVSVAGYFGLRKGCGVGEPDHKSCVWRIAMLGLLPFLLWWLFKVWYGIHGDLQFGRMLLHPLRSATEAWHRLPLIFATFGRALQLNNIPLLLVAMLGAMLLRRYVAGISDNQNQALLPVDAALLLMFYMAACALIIAVFCVTPYDPRWHMATALPRLLQLPTLLLAASVVLILNQLEQNSFSHKDTKTQSRKIEC